MTSTSKPIIYVGIDESWKDTGALEWALQESLLRHEPLRAVHVVEEKLRHAPYFEPTVIDDAATGLVDDVQKHLDGLPTTLDHVADVAVGPPAEMLAGLSEGSRMLVVGRRGIGAFKRLLIGSTTEAVVHKAQVPVVVVPEGWQRPRAGAPVLVGLDDSGDSNAALEFAMTVAAERKAPVRLVHVWDLPNIYSWDAMNVAGLADEWAQGASRHVQGVAEQWRHKYPDLRISVDVRRSHPVSGLLEAAEDYRAQLIVLGGRVHSRLAEVLLGSVARGVLHHATCPVAIVREPAGTP